MYGMHRCAGAMEGSSTCEKGGGVDFRATLSLLNFLVKRLYGHIAGNSVEIATWTFLV